MAVSLTCLCGAYMQIDDRFVGQTVPCPDCGRSLLAAAAGKGPCHTSGLALTSIILALVGAFTVVGTVLAMICGGLALRSIKRNPDNLSGKGYAFAGIGLALVFTGISLLVYGMAESWGLDRWLRLPEWAGKLDYAEALAITSDKGFSLTRPSLAWGVFRGPDETEFDRRQLPFSHRDSLILVQVAEDASAIGFSFWKAQLLDELETYRQTALDNFSKSELIRLLSRRRRTSAIPMAVRSSKLLAEGGREIQELVVDLAPGKHERTFLLRIIRGGDDIYVVAAGARKSRFAHLKTQLRQVVESFKIGR